jgi:L-alanine-DL-glutamate epimerase-like enolase superfamily enzyme
MELSFQARTLRLAETFTIARESRDEEVVVGVEIRHDGVVGIGEAAPIDRYDETPESACAFLDRAGPLLGDDPFALEEIEARLRRHPGEMAAKAALDAALHDLVGKLCGQPTWRLLGLRRRTPLTTFTIGIDSVERTRDRTRRAVDAGYRMLKVKVGGADDLARLEAIRAETALPIRVDANEGWTLEDARELLPELERAQVELIEQPFPAAEIEPYLGLRALGSGIPIVIDEGCHTLADVAAVARYADGVNLKLAKTGGIREALRMIAAARALGLRVMLGCMIESSAGIAAAAQISSLCDHVDLDGHLLVRDDPFTGLGFEDGAIVLSTAPGLGVEPAAAA